VTAAFTNMVLVIGPDEVGHLRRLLVVREVRERLTLLVDEAMKVRAPAAVIAVPLQPMQRPPGRNPFVAPRARPPKTLGARGRR
jgi:hypothetical protein